MAYWVCRVGASAWTISRVNRPWSATCHVERGILRTRGNLFKVYAIFDTLHGGSMVKTVHALAAIASVRLYVENRKRVLQRAKVTQKRWRLEMRKR